MQCKQNGPALANMAQYGATFLCPLPIPQFPLVPRLTFRYDCRQTQRGGTLKPANNCPFTPAVPAPASLLSCKKKIVWWSSLLDEAESLQKGPQSDTPPQKQT
eukprot:1136703-Pelagomonas_calceolata.AAC.5